MKSPYIGKDENEWQEITQNLLNSHPLNQKEIVDIILKAWDCIFESKICSLQIGKDIFPNPQMLGYFIETLTAVKLAEKYPHIWKHGTEKHEKDIVYLQNDDFSIEIKSSSHASQIFGNRSYAQEQSDNATKDKSGFYLTINHGLNEETQQFEIKLIRFGFLEHTDWRGQKSAKGQQANLSPKVYKNKFVKLYESPEKSKKKRNSKTK
ncbi:MAG: ScaI family restriction endonuclease [Thermoflexibacter sp.]|jgi:hypothetical protein|nr:ScaI family restriction endonuclease [Thermoflexibacter sp.]